MTAGGGRDAADLCRLIDHSPTPFHAVAEIVQRLKSAGFTALDERSRWALAPGDERYVVREGSLTAFRIGSAPPSSSGFRIIGAHTDSPTLKVRPRHDVRRFGYRLVGVEPYGGLLLHTWLDRDLTVAGRLAVADGGPEPRTVLTRLAGAPLRIPALAIHLYREVAQEGLKLDPQRHAVPVSGLGGDRLPDLIDALADAAGVDAGAVVGWDLMLADTQPPTVGGAADEFVFSARLDNLASCHAGIAALADAEPGSATQVMVANDHEEVGSHSAEGASGPFLADVLSRIVAVTEPGDAQALPVALARSRMVSADTAHAVHPNYADRHEPEHRPVLGGGPVLKVNANQAYASDAATAGWFALCCAEAGVPLQHFVTRADIPCGSTIGPLTATRLGIPTVDAGNPVLSMHSCREQAGAGDVGAMIAALTRHVSR